MCACTVARVGTEQYEDDVAAATRSEREQRSWRQAYAVVMWRQCVSNERFAPPTTKTLGLTLLRTYR